MLDLLQRQKFMMKILSSIFLITDLTISLGRTVLSPASSMSKSISIRLERATASLGTTTMSSPSNSPFLTALPKTLDFLVHLASLYLELKKSPITLTVRRGMNLIGGRGDCFLKIYPHPYLPFIYVRPH